MKSWNLKKLANYSTRIFVFVGLSWICIVLFFLLPREKLQPHLVFTSSRGTPESLTTAKPPTVPAALHLIVPASKPDPNLCKVLLSAGILGYPAPVVVNWNQTFDDDRYVEGGSHLAKVSGVHSYLAALEVAQDDDLVLMIDGYDTWLQLRPQTLVSRFYAINRDANARLARQLGKAKSTHKIQQEVVFGVQKRCWPWTFDDPPCYAAPESTLPEDIYGSDTDTDVGYEPNPYIKFRPRYTNSGVAMGTARAMRNLFAQALKMLQELEGEANMGSDQYIFSHIIGDQNVWREAMRRDSLNSSKSGSVIGRGLHSFSSLLSPQSSNIAPRSAIQYKEEHIQEVRQKAFAQPDGRFEFGIGYDHWSLLGLNTVFAEEETEWLTWANSTRITEVETSYKLLEAKSRLHKFPADISHTPPPFWTFNDEPLLPRNMPWEDVPLFTNAYTGVVPVVIHHNAHRDGRKALREEWWDRLWLQPQARVLYDSSVYEPTIPIAYGGGEDKAGEDGPRREFWPSERFKGGFRKGQRSEDDWVTFEEVCGDYHEEVFRDGKGPWHLPEAH